MWKCKGGLRFDKRSVQVGLKFEMVQKRLGGKNSARGDAALQSNVLGMAAWA